MVNALVSYTNNTDSIEVNANQSLKANFNDIITQFKSSSKIATSIEKKLSVYIERASNIEKTIREERQRILLANLENQIGHIVQKCRHAHFISNKEFTRKD